jgi:hypothetical protein
MKTRTGFVSNSSSSSFVLLTSQETLKAVLKEYSVEQRKFIRALIGSPRKGKICGETVSDYSDVYSSYGISEAYEENIGQNIKVVNQNGCHHEFDRNAMKYCPECGRPAIVQIEDGEYLDPEEEGLALFDEFLKNINKKDDAYGYLIWY